jgi:hypothetical protein
MEAAHGGDPAPEWDLATAGYRRAIALAPGYSDAYVDLGTVFAGRADYEQHRGGDPRPSVAEAIASHAKAIELKADNSMAWLDIGVAWSIQAEWERAKGIDCAPSVDAEVRANRKVLELKPDYVYGYDNLAAAWYLLGLQRLDRGLDPSDLVGQGRAILAAGRKLDANDAYNAQFGARLELIAARYALAGADAAARFTDAEAGIARALALDPENADAYVVAAEIQRWRAEWRKRRGESTAPAIASGLDAAARALTINPELAQAHAVRGALLALSGKPEDARASLQHALALNPLLARDYPPP